MKKIIFCLFFLMLLGGCSTKKTEKYETIIEEMVSESDKYIMVYNEAGYYNTDCYYVQGLKMIGNESVLKNEELRAQIKNYYDPLIEDADIYLLSKIAIVYDAFSLESNIKNIILTKEKPSYDYGMAFTLWALALLDIDDEDYINYVRDFDNATYKDCDYAGMCALALSYFQADLSNIISFIDEEIKNNFPSSWSGKNCCSIAFAYLGYLLTDNLDKIDLEEIYHYYENKAFRNLDNEDLDYGYASPQAFLMLCYYQNYA